MRYRTQIFKTVTLFLQGVRRVAGSLYIYLFSLQLVRLFAVGRVHEFTRDDDARAGYKRVHLFDYDTEKTITN